MKKTMPTYQTARTINPGQPNADWGEAPDVEMFYGRESELNLLRHWIVGERCRMIALNGMGGIGKTVLSVKLAQQIEPHFNYLIWRSLRDAPPLEDILEECLQFLANPQPYLGSDSIETKILQLFDYLRQYRCLLVLDNIEAILQEGFGVGRFREGYEAYGQLIVRLAQGEHQSCLILTSREKPNMVADLEGRNRSVRAIHLEGLPEKDARRILQNKDLFGADETWTQLIEKYSGNPLALKLVAETIQRLFGGDISSFLTEGEGIFGDVRDLLSQQVDRLYDSEQEIMYWLAIEREAVSLAVLQDDLVHPLPEQELSDILIGLEKRSLVEQRGNEYTLQNVVMEYMTEQFIRRIYEEINDEKLNLLISHSLIKAQTKDHLRTGQVRMILNPILNELIDGFEGKVGVENRLAELLQLLHRNCSREPGYAAGNLLNLLLQLKGNANGYDFSNLVVWQAYLQGIELHDTNFDQADLSKSVFAQTFGSVFSVALSPDGRLLAAGTGDGDVYIWRVPGGQQVLTCKGHTDWVWTVAFSPDAQTLATGSGDHTIRLWHIETGQCLRVLAEHTDPVWSVAFHPNGERLASSSGDRTVRLWDVGSGRCLNILKAHTDQVSTVIFSPDGSLLASSSEDQTICLWQSETGKLIRTLTGHTNWIWSIDFSPDGQILASGSQDATIRFWQVETGQCLKIIQEHTKQIWTVAFSPDGRTLASGSEDYTLRLWDVQTGRWLKTLQGHTGRVRSLAFGPDDSILVSGAGDQTIRFWDIKSGQCLNTMQGYTNPIWSVAFSPDGQTLASGSGDRTIRFWNVQTGEELKTPWAHEGWVTTVAFSSDGQKLASGGEDRTIRIWDMATGACLKSLLGHTDRILSVAFSPDGRLLASGSRDMTVRLWEVESGKCLHVLRGHRDRVRSVAFSPNGQILISGSEDHVIRVWNVEMGIYLHPLAGHQDRVMAVAFSPDGHTLASGSVDQTVRLWQLTGQCLKTLQGHTGTVWSVTFSPDGRTLASGGLDKTVRLWDVASGQEVQRLTGHDNSVRTVVFAANGDLLASGGLDETIKLWDIRSGKCRQTMRADRPYERMKITGVIGLSEAQKAELKRLGAVDEA